MSEKRGKGESTVKREAYVNFTLSALVHDLANGLHQVSAHFRSIVCREDSTVGFIRLMFSSVQMITIGNKADKKSL